MKTARFILGILFAGLCYFALGAVASPAAPRFARIAYDEERVIASDESLNVDVPQFDPGLGTLTAVTITGTMRFVPPIWYTGDKEWGAVFTAEDYSASAPNPSPAWYGQLSGCPPSPAPTEGDSDGFWQKVRFKVGTATQVAPTHDLGIVYVEDSYDYFGPQQKTIEVHGETTIEDEDITYTTDLSSWIGTGDITWTFDSDYSVTAESCAVGGSPQLGWDVWAEVEVAYTYTPF